MQITISLSDILAEWAQAAGLLASERLEGLLEEALRREAAERLLKMSQRFQAAIASGELETISEEEIVEEVRAVRAERRAQTMAR